MIVEALDVCAALCWLPSPHKEPILNADTEAAIRHIYEQWHETVVRRDIRGLMELLCRGRDSRKPTDLRCSARTRLRNPPGQCGYRRLFRRCFVYPVERPRPVVQDGTLLRQRPPADVGISPRDPGRGPNRSGRGHGRVWRPDHSPSRLLGLAWFQSAVQSAGRHEVGAVMVTAGIERRRILRGGERARMGPRQR
jgi:hypothetical protein